MMLFCAVDLMMFPVFALQIMILEVNPVCHGEAGDTDWIKMP